MRSVFEITDEKIIDDLLNSAEYGTLALCENNRPYSVPINFVQHNDVLYFHGAQKGRKMGILKTNDYASFSVVESHSLIQSYFSSTEGLACPATHFFKSVIIDGQIEIVEDYEEKLAVFTALMQKLQPEGNYKPLSDKEYTTAVNATAVYKLIPSERRAKFKFGQHLDAERFEMVLKHLKERGTEKDLETIAMMNTFREEKTI